MSIVLRHKIEASERSAQELEFQLHGEHRRAMLCYDIEDLMRSAVNLLQDIAKDVERWQDDSAPGRAVESDELASLGPEWEGLYRRLAGVFEKSFDLIRAIEKTSPSLEGKREFLAAWRELRGIVCFTHDRVEIAAEQAKSGEMRPLGEVEDELWDTPDN